MHINPQGDVIVRPSILEKRMMPSAGLKAKPHYLDSYRASLIAAIRAQFGQKRLKASAAALCFL